MLKEIHIQNYAVIDHLTLEFEPGLTLLSGETGSGKSILVDALGLALGGRASPDVIRTGAQRATITVVFSVAADEANAAAYAVGSKVEPAWRRWLEEYGLAAGDEPEIILRREIQAGGKSRLLVNDQPATLVAIRALARSLAEVHGQNEHVILFAPEAQIELLDEFSGLENKVTKVGLLYARCRELGREFENLNQNEQDRLRAVDLLQFQLQELERARLQPGEDAKLAAEKQVLGNLERIRSTAAHAFGQIYEEEGAACARLTSAIRDLQELSRYDPHLERHLEPLVAARATLEDTSYFLRDYLEELKAEPGRLEEVDDRLALIGKLKRKYGSTIEEMLAYREHAQRQLTTLEHVDERRQVLLRELEGAVAEYQELAQQLSEDRRVGARKLEKLVREELAQLGMEKTRFEILFRTREISKGKSGTGNAAMEGDPSLSNFGSQSSDFRQTSPSTASVPATLGGARGIDQVEFLISPNPGEELRPLEKIASGGELSRLMLALKTVAGRARWEGKAAARSVAGSGAARPLAPTFVFDEVDAGIGGRVAESVGLRLKRLARHAQVLCVTHLPQIACFADHHFYVEKLERDGRTLTTVKNLEARKDRVAELARMLSGSQVTDAVLKHAMAMLKHAEEA